MAFEISHIKVDVKTCKPNDEVGIRNIKLPSSEKTYYLDNENLSYLMWDSLKHDNHAPIPNY